MLKIPKKHIFHHWFLKGKVYAEKIFLLSLMVTHIEKFVIILYRFLISKWKVPTFNRKVQQLCCQRGSPMGELSYQLHIRNTHISKVHTHLCHFVELYNFIFQQVLKGIWSACDAALKHDRVFWIGIKRSRKNSDWVNTGDAKVTWCKSLFR